MKTYKRIKKDQAIKLIEPPAFYCQYLDKIHAAIQGLASVDGADAWVDGCKDASQKYYDAYIKSIEPNYIRMD